MKNKFDYMSMEELSRLIRNQGEDRTLREEAARQLAKRENHLFKKSPISRAIIPFDYGV